MYIYIHFLNNRNSLTDQMYVRQLDYSVYSAGVHLVWLQHAIVHTTYKCTTQGIHFR